MSEAKLSIFRVKEQVDPRWSSSPVARAQVSLENPPDFGDPEMNRQAAAYQKTWTREIQAKLARLSTRGREVVGKDRGHRMGEEIIIPAIREVVEEVRIGERKR
jgi:hypothetical protein